MDLTSCTGRTFIAVRHCNNIGESVRSRLSTCRVCRNSNARPNILTASTAILLTGGSPLYPSLRGKSTGQRIIPGARRDLPRIVFSFTATFSVTFLSHALFSSLFPFFIRRRRWLFWSSPHIASLLDLFIGWIISVAPVSRSVEKASLVGNASDGCFG